MPSLSCPCRAGVYETIHVYTAPPAGETPFDFGGRRYRRVLRRCEDCRHVISVAEVDSGRLYEGAYVDATYPGEDGLRRAFARIVGLDPARSDNHGRVRRVRAFMDGRLETGPDRAPTLLDVGSGLGVFPKAMAEAGWQCTALDPDERACRHIRAAAGVEAVCADFNDWEDPRRFDLVTFNKVLEHVREPEPMLARARQFVPEGGPGGGGIVYVELPDADAAFADGPHREEFFIEHHHVFSLRSIVRLAENAGFVPLAVERLREPSGKYTLLAFLA